MNIRELETVIEQCQSRLAQLRVENTQGDEDSDDGEDIDKADADAQTPPIEAAERGHEAVVKCVVKALLEAGADVNEAGGEGATPLH
ncbi:uncharacterized protein MICPUCDRAFT_54846 [Micromonas pusilla CCMP1545]|uniref:Predicted protein n=1 Tax=Micromonas pusilla (strain CCMP1545) TaxID=564608 RepID=C1NAC8_MICPC|nr:uncharacterized protein MICPUCDRAFT_54846 [Micromonas pusilla CCMP1545]EEH50862.1 predicted protein [Micromonas pusilla CCMP1545]|eukprot:XP_003064882.1 predicted protein [Micromonas pusilla CCMP1545]